MPRKTPVDRSQAPPTTSADLDPYIGGGPVVQTGSGGDPGPYRNNRGSDSEDSVQDKASIEYNEEEEEIEIKPKEREILQESQKEPETTKEPRAQRDQKAKRDQENQKDHKIQKDKNKRRTRTR